MSSLWLLEAKAYPEENRSAEAISKRYWLRPGTYTVGRPGTSSDIALLEDKSISRNHAIVIVPSLQEWLHTGAPYVEIKDTSRYGTLVAERNDLQADGVTKQTLRAFDRYMLRFGYQSPFKLYNIANTTLCLHPAISQDTRQAAQALGMPILNEPQASKEGTLFIPPAACVPVDGPILSAALHACRLVAPDWVHKCCERKVWEGSCPSEANFPVELRYIDADGASKSCNSMHALMGAAGRGLFKGMVLVWTKETSDDALALAAELLGVENLECLSAKAAASRFPSTSIVVLPSADAAPPPGLEPHRRTTPQCLLAAFVEGNPDIVPLPVAATPTASPEALTPATKGKAPMPSVVDEIPVSASPRPSPGTRNTGKRKATVASLEKESDSSTKRRRGPTPTKAKAAPAPAVETAAPKPTKSPRAARAKPSVSVPHSEGWKSAAYKETLREEPQATVLPDSDEEVEEGNGEVAKNSSAAGKNITTSAKFTGDVTFDEGVMVLSEGAPPAAAEQGGSGAVNFKAFRRKGQAHAIGRARIIPYQPEPYYRIASADTEAFLRAEEERAAQRAAAERLFDQTGAKGKGKAPARTSRPAAAAITRRR